MLILLLDDAHSLSELKVIPEICVKSYDSAVVTVVAWIYLGLEHRNAANCPAFTVLYRLLAVKTSSSYFDWPERVSDPLFPTLQRHVELVRHLSNNLMVTVFLCCISFSVHPAVNVK